MLFAMLKAGLAKLQKNAFYALFHNSKALISLLVRFFQSPIKSKYLYYSIFISRPAFSHFRIVKIRRSTYLMLFKNVVLKLHNLLKGWLGLHIQELDGNSRIWPGSQDFFPHVSRATSFWFSLDR